MTKIVRMDTMKLGHPLQMKYRPPAKTFHLILLFFYKQIELIY